MSNAAPPTWVRELPLPSGAWRCLVGLWGFAKYGAEAPAQVWPARETLALATGQKPATVAKQLRKLADLRWILRAPNGVLWLAWRIPWSSGRIPWSSDTPVAEPTTTVTGPDTPVVASRRPQSSHNLQEPSKEHSSNVEVERATPTTSVKPAGSGVLDPCANDWRKNRARIQLEAERARAAHPEQAGVLPPAVLDAVDPEHRDAWRQEAASAFWVQCMTERRRELKLDDARTGRVLATWNADAADGVQDGQPSSRELWKAVNASWVRKAAGLGDSTPTAKLRPGHLPMGGALRIVGGPS